MSYSQHKKRVRNILFMSAIGIYFVFSLLFATIPSSSGNYDTFTISTEQTTASSSVVKFDKDYTYNFGIYVSQAQDSSNSYAIIIEVVYFKQSFFTNKYQQIGNETTSIMLDYHDIELNLRTATNIEKYDYFLIRVQLTTVVHEIDEYISVYGYVENNMPVYLTDNGWFNFLSFVCIFATAFVFETQWNKYYLAKQIRQLGDSDYDNAIDPREFLAQMAKANDHNLQEAKIRHDSEQEVIKIKQKAEKDFRLQK